MKITATELAKILNLTPQRISQLLKDEIIKEPFEFPRTVTDYIIYLRKKIKNFNGFLSRRGVRKNFNLESFPTENLEPFLITDLKTFEGFQNQKKEIKNDAY